MGLEIKKLDRGAGASATVVAEQRLWLTADKDELVPDGDPRARFLFSVPGRAIPYADALRYGLLDEPAEPEPEPEDNSEPEPSSEPEPAGSMGAGEEQAEASAEAEEPPEPKPKKQSKAKAKLKKLKKQKG